MSKKNIIPRKKYALWIAHKGICSYCKEPIRFKDVWVDHILPEHLLKTPDELAQIIKEYELDKDFDIEDYCNWLPSHWRCNVDKGGTIFDRGTARFHINIAQSKVSVARKKEETIIRNLKKDKLLFSLEVAISEGLLSIQDVFQILQQEAIIQGYKEEPTIITFGLNYYNLWESESRPDWLDEYEPFDYPVVCNLLERYLVKKLKFLLSCYFYYPEASKRNGETISVRLAFIQLDRSEISRFKSELWEILEFEKYSSIYGAFDKNYQNRNPLNN